MIEKIAYYKELIYKQAEKAWKRNIGDMSEESRQKLIDSGSLNYKKELDGLHKGTNKIVTAYGGERKKLGDGSDLVSKTKKMLSKADIAKKMGINKSNIDGVMEQLVEGMQQGKNATFLDSHRKPKIKPAIYTGDLSRSMITRDQSPLKSNLEKRYLNAIAARHEADELREGTKVYNNPKKHLAYKNSKLPLTTSSSHLNAKVLARESAHSAVAPKSVKDLFHGIRSNLTGEIPVWEEALGKQWYGKKGIYDKKLGKKMENMSMKVNKDAFSELGLKPRPMTTLKPSRDIASRFGNIIKKIKRI